MSGHRRESTTKGFARANKLLQTRIRKASESRGFAESRLLTHWSEIVGAELAAAARPVEVSYGRGGLGATLVVLCKGAMAPIVSMRREEIKSRVNACYGFAAIRDVRITQTSATGFAEPAAEFQPPPAAADDKTKARARDAARDIGDERLRSALQALGENVLGPDASGTRQERSE